MDHVLYSINSSDGSMIWKTESLGGALVGTPTLDGQDVLYVGTFGNELLAINRQDGAILWRTPTDYWIWSGPALDDGILYFGDLRATYMPSALTAAPSGKNP
jgi:outer membrane protein assembly factor BamB